MMVDFGRFNKYLEMASLNGDGDEQTASGDMSVASSSDIGGTSGGGGGGEDAAMKTISISSRASAPDSYGWSNESGLTAMLVAREQKFAKLLEEKERIEQEVANYARKIQNQKNVGEGMRHQTGSTNVNCTQASVNKSQRPVRRDGCG